MLFCIDPFPLPFPVPDVFNDSKKYFYFVTIGFSPMPKSFVALHSEINCSFYKTSVC